ncbi:ATP-dependent DNA helicase RecG [Pyruvatibacter sp.]|uniref:ATP-dependent DNA helicase RecG n=1 Tax=Pyruvatibacter sp. TaxID=1981328 RepID=UPI0032EF93AA
MTSSSASSATSKPPPPKGRPEALFPLFAEAAKLPGIGPRLQKLLEKLTGPKVVDLLWHLPTGVIDRRHRPYVSEAQPGTIATLEIVVGPHRPPSQGSRAPYRIACSDDTGEITLTFFHAREDYLRRTLPEGERRIISGEVEAYGGQIQMTHPDHILKPEDADTLPPYEPVYPLTAGLSGKVLTKAVAAALERVPELPEWLDAAWARQQHYPEWHDAVRAAHTPQAAEGVDPKHPARARLAYDELLANQLALALVRARMKRARGRPLSGDGNLRRKVEVSLPFDLTRGQRVAIAEIEADLKEPYRMLRLLQGDVGSGKTLVALMAMLVAVEAGAQAALMAPTEILARQHAKTLEPLCAAAGIRMAILTGRDKGKAREAIVAAAEAGEIDILVGTHALFQGSVAFRDLAVAVVDEQHRFGVRERMELSSKGVAGTDVLVMTATPIPRTLQLTAYGDMDVSRLTEKPAGRQPITTRALPLERLDDVIAGLGRAVREGQQVYWVCPLVEESDVLDVAAAEERYAGLKATLGANIGMVHGRMKGAEREQVMTAFQAGEIDILVATTVIEVGVDVPNASIMVIEHAERFGLAQLHQLRGRVGRGSAASSCLLLYKAPLGNMAKQRIATLRDTEDGFIIAEEDLILRGAGEVLGTRQSGLPQFRLASLEDHADLISVARDDVELILNRDPELETDRGQALRGLLYLFERDEAIRYLRAG